MSVVSKIRLVRLSAGCTGALVILHHSGRPAPSMKHNMAATLQHAQVPPAIEPEDAESAK